MELLPYFIDAEEAVEAYKSTPDLTDAFRACVVGILSREGLRNRDIRECLGIRHVYEVTHLKRVGLALSESELQLWHNNPQRITLGHLRAISKLDRQRRENLMRGLLVNRQSVSNFEQLAKGESVNEDTDSKRYAEALGEAIGRQIRIEFNRSTQTGKLVLSFYSLDDLEEISGALSQRFSANQVK